MPHFVLEHSTNIDADTLALDTLFAKLHQTALDTGLFPLKGMRSRAHPCDTYHIADGNPEHVFVHLEVMIGVGRSDGEKELTSKQLFAVLTEHFKTSSEVRGTALSFELRELEPVFKYNANNVGDYL